MPVYVAPISWGLGDAVVSLPVVQFFIDRGDETHFVVRSHLQAGLVERIDGLAGAIDEKALDVEQFESTRSRTGKWLLNLREHPIQTNYWWGSLEFERDYTNHKINDILKIICHDAGIEPKFDRLVPLNCFWKKGMKRTIAFVPGSDGTHKHWRTESWVRLAQMLSEGGWNIIGLGEPEHCEAVRELIDAGLPWQQTATVGDAVDVLSSCAAAVGVDTGLTHIAVQQGTPTVALYKRNSIYYRPYSHALIIEAEPCAESCREKFLARAINKITSFTPDFEHKPWTCEVPEAERCMSTITPEAVFSKVEQAVASNGRNRLIPNA